MECFDQEKPVELEKTLASLNKGNRLEKSLQKLFSVWEL